MGIGLEGGRQPISKAGESPSGGFGIYGSQIMRGGA